MLKEIEKLTMETRGWISRKPKEENVVFIASGGMDSTIGIAQVISKYNCNVYPLFVCRSSKNMKYEEKAFDKLMMYLKKKYPDNLKSVEKVRVEVPPLKFKKGLTQLRLETIGHALRNVSLQSIGIQYATWLNDNRDLNIKTLFVGSIADDGFPHNKLEAFRLMTLLTCWDQKDYDWLITSPFIDPLLDEIPDNKTDNIKWAIEQDLPLKYTRTCTLGGEKACGICGDCIKRRNAFENAGFEDPAYI